MICLTINTSSIIVLSNYSYVGSLSWGVVGILGVISFNKIDFPSPSSYQVPITPQLQMGLYAHLPQPLYAGLSSGLNLWRFYRSLHSHCEFICANVLLCLEITISLMFWDHYYKSCIKFFRSNDLINHLLFKLWVQFSFSKANWPQPFLPSYIYFNTLPKELCNLGYFSLNLNRLWLRQKRQPCHICLVLLGH